MMKKMLAGFALGLAAFSLAVAAPAASESQKETKPAATAPSGIDAMKELKTDGKTGAKAGSSSAARAAQKESNKKADADYKEARAKCNDLKANEKDVCVAEAQAARTKTKAEASAVSQNTASAKRKALVDIAAADYAVAKAKCGSQQGDAKKTCLDEAKNARAKATLEPPTQDKAGTMMEPKSQERTEQAGTRASQPAK